MSDGNSRTITYNNFFSTIIRMMKRESGEIMGVMMGSTGVQEPREKVGESSVVATWGCGGGVELEGGRDGLALGNCCWKAEQRYEE